MQGAIQSFLSHGNVVKTAVLQRIRLINPMLRPVVFSRSESVSSARMEEHGFESTTISDILKAKGKGADGSWLWCTTDDSVYDAVQSVSFPFYERSCFYSVYRIQVSDFVATNYYLCRWHSIMLVPWLSLNLESKTPLQESLLREVFDM